MGAFSKKKQKIKKREKKAFSTFAIFLCIDSAEVRAVPRLHDCNI